jgi:hypothetical protein
MTYNAEQVAFMLHEAIDQNREYKSWHCSTQHLMALVERVVAEEREACAEVCKKHADVYAKLEQNPTAQSAWAACIDNRDAIRARGQA